MAGEADAFLLLIVAFIFPPAAVAFVAGCGADLCLNILLTILGYLPGCIHAFWLVLKRSEANERYGYRNWVYTGMGEYAPHDARPPSSGQVFLPYNQQGVNPPPPPPPPPPGQYVPQQTQQAPVDQKQGGYAPQQAPRTDSQYSGHQAPSQAPADQKQSGYAPQQAPRTDSQYGGYQTQSQAPADQKQSGYATPPAPRTDSQYGGYQTQSQAPVDQKSDVRMPQAAPSGQ